MSKKKRIYMDVCALNRPFDDMNNFRIKMEAQAIIFLIQRIIKGTYILCNSDIIEYEWSQIPMFEKMSLVKRVLDLSKEKIIINFNITELAKEFEDANIKPLDALHLASSIIGECDCLISTDDKFLKKTKKYIDKIKTFNPLEFYLYEAMN